MAGQPEILPCPFCDKGSISCMHFPSSVKIRHRAGSFGKGNLYSRSADVWIIKSGCSICGKPSEEVEKELRKKNMI